MVLSVKTNTAVEAGSLGQLSALMNFTQVFFLPTAAFKMWRKFSTAICMSAVVNLFDGALRN